MIACIVSCADTAPTHSSLSTEHVRHLSLTPNASRSNSNPQGPNLSMSRHKIWSSELGMMFLWPPSSPLSQSDRM
uniref:Uncharacterized protein n=1 Tax=Triticum urartu TaxID=4572 RepID=A0A8R7UVU1_TRIUA